MFFEDLINVERLGIVEDADFYTVRYRGEEYHIAKARESSFRIYEHGSMAMEQRQVQIIDPSLQILQDDLVPDEFKEVMCFHELRENEYRAAGFKDAHNRAVNDEILYVIKFFDKKKQKRYFNFSRRYRRGEKPITNARRLLPNMDSEEAYDGGKELPDEVFDQIGNSLVEILFMDAKYSLRAISYWPDKRFERYADKLFEAAWQDPEGLADLGRELPNKRFDRFSCQILKAALINSEQAYRALQYWINDRQEMFARQLITKVAEDPDLALKAFMHLPSYDLKNDSRTEDLISSRDIFIDSIFQSPNASLKAGSLVPIKFKKSLLARKLAKSVARDPAVLERARQEWPKYLSKYLP